MGQFKKNLQNVEDKKAVGCWSRFNGDIESDWVKTKSKFGNSTGGGSST